MLLMVPGIRGKAMLIIVMGIVMALGSNTFEVSPARSIGGVAGVSVI